VSALVAALRRFPPNTDPGMKKLMHDAIASEIEVLRAQVDHYEKLRGGQITGREITSLHELPVWLIEARIAARLTQRHLAARIGVAEQQIRRWEANGARRPRRMILGTYVHNHGVWNDQGQPPQCGRRRGRHRGRRAHAGQRSNAGPSSRFSATVSRLWRFMAGRDAGGYPLSSGVSLLRSPHAAVKNGGRETVPEHGAKWFSK